MSAAAHARAGAARGWGITARAAAAILGGYALATLVAMDCAALLPGPAVEATLTGMLSGLVVQAGAVIWAFAARTAWRGWAGILAAGLPLAAAMCMHLGMPLGGLGR